MVKKKKKRKSHQIHSRVVPHHLLAKAERLIISARWAHLPPRSHKFNIKSQYLTAALPTSKPFQVLNQEGYQQEIPRDNLLGRYKTWIPELEENHLLESSVYLSTNVISVSMKTQKCSGKWEQQMWKGLFSFPFIPTRRLRVNLVSGSAEMMSIRQDNGGEKASSHN